MPIIAVGAAIAASVVAGSAVAATVGGIAAISAVTAFEVVAAVGATVAAVGAVTRDKTLTLVGGAIGLIGGIGGLASSAGVLGATAASDAPIFGAAPAASTSSEAAGTAGGFAEGLSPATSGTAGGAIESGTWDAATTAADQASANTIPFVADGLPEGQNDIATFSSVADKATDPASTLAKTVDPSVSLGGTAPSGAIDPATGLPITDPTRGLLNGQTASASTTQPAVDQFGVPTAPPETAPPAGTSAAWQTPGKWTPGINDASGTSTISEDGVFGSILKFANDNKTLASGVLTVGGKLLEGAFSSLTPAQVSALDAQAAANNAAAAMSNQQRANLAMPKATAQLAPVTGTPGPIIPASGAVGGPGIINQPPRLAPVTGAPV